ncbi:Sybindin-like family-domain-containing protein [Halteromyces radiatus]|uniref:Sybindin-like family-domain-containing protein n=1 Tax=Halteromyces radiatus TaxID=101107 RepID=UPI00221F6969|nr:Sybindin-like family-domain-containing protein [Halteromyces radiatus]KAI8097688.1 Sybindin-like family-domain-containing protein [Halteromyces radiatus]
MTIHNLYIFDRHCQCIYFQKWSHQNKSNLGSSSVNGNSVNSTSQTGSSRLGLTTSSRLSQSNTSISDTNNNNSSSHASNSMTQNEDRSSSATYLGTMTQQSGLAAGSVMSIEEEAKLVYGVILSLRNFVRKLTPSSNGDNQDGFISYCTSTYRLHYYETPTGLKFVLNTDPATEGMRPVLKQIYVQLYVDFVVKNGLMRFDDTRWEISQGLLLQQQQPQHSSDDQQQQQSQPPPPGNISNELFRIAVDRFVRSLTVFE